jgi:hypothetical protein
VSGLALSSMKSHIIIDDLSQVCKDEATLQ